MAENLNTTRHSSGADIPLVEDTSTWNALTYTDKAYCYYLNSSSNGEIYGALYTWAAAMNGAGSSSSNPSGIQGVCPSGWHLPSDAEWTELTDYLGGASDAGGQLKEAGYTHWAFPNTGATNESGFTALPGGHRSNGGEFYELGEGAFFLITTERDSSTIWSRIMRYSYSAVTLGSSYKDNGFSVRCVKDN